MKITAVQKEVALSYHKVRGLYFLVDIFCGDYINCMLIKDFKFKIIEYVVFNFICGMYLFSYNF